MPISILAYSTDKEAETEGRWLTLRTKHGEWRVKVSRMGRDPEGARLFNELMEEFVGQDELPRGEHERILREVVARALLKDWEGLLDEKGEEIPFKPETAAALMEAHADLFHAIWNATEDAENFRQVREEKAVGNSGRSSGGRRSGGRTSKS